VEEDLAEAAVVYPQDAHGCFLKSLQCEWGNSGGWWRGLRCKKVFWLNLPKVCQTEKTSLPGHFFSQASLPNRLNKSARGGQFGVAIIDAETLESFTVMAWYALECSFFIIIV